MRSVKSVIDSWDPINLLLHAPNDEYHSEIEEIQNILLFADSPDKLADAIQKVFEESFGKDMFKEKIEDCERIAQILLEEC